MPRCDWGANCDCSDCRTCKYCGREMKSHVSSSFKSNTDSISYTCSFCDDPKNSEQCQVCKASILKFQMENHKQWHAEEAKKQQERIEHCRFSFGKYRGTKVSKVFEKDKGYIRWLLMNVKNFKEKDEYKSIKYFTLKK